MELPIPHKGTSGELAAPFGVCCREGRSCSELPKTVREKFSDSSCVGKGKRAGQCPPRRATFSENRSCVVVVDGLGGGNGADYGERLVAEGFAVVENVVESV